MKITAPVRIDISGGWPDSDPYRKDFGGAVLNAAITRTDMPYRVCATLDGFLKTEPGNVLPHSGQGTSGALRAVELAASNPALLQDRMDLIRRVWLFENRVIGFRAGVQDEAAAIYGGVNYWEFGSGPGESVAIKRVPIPRDRAELLEERLVLMYFGESHLSANIHDLVFGPENYENSIPKLDRMKEIAFQMKGMLLDNFHETQFGDYINETWELQRSLHSSIESKSMKTIQKALRGDYLAYRAIGAGGGGSGIYYGEAPKICESFRIAQELGKIPPNAKLIPFKFEYSGIRRED